MARTIAMMQPYLFPYLGYFQLIAAADVFVLRDDLQYVRSGWVNRNRILSDGESKLMTFPLKKDRFELPVNQRELCDTFGDHIDRLIGEIVECYQKAPCFAQVMPMIERLIRFPQSNIALYAEHMIREICAYLRIFTPIMRGSDLHLDTTLDRQERVMRIAKTFSATTFVNPEGGSVSYDRELFAENGMKLHFFRMDSVVYRQFKQPFVANLSIIDVLMFNRVEHVQQMLTSYSLEKGESAVTDEFLFQLKIPTDVVSARSNRIAVE